MPEDVCRAGVGAVVVVSVCSEHGCIAGDSYSLTKVVVFGAIGGNQLGDFRLGAGRSQTGTETDCNHNSQDENQLLALQQPDEELIIRLRGTVYRIK